MRCSFYTAAPGRRSSAGRWGFVTSSNRQGPQPTWYSASRGSHRNGSKWIQRYSCQNTAICQRIEVEYEWLLTQKLILQPRAGFETGANTQPDFGLGSGVRGTELGLRLRYEWHRKLAPYIGVSWHRLYGQTADLARVDGESDNQVSFLAGLRMRF